MSPEKGRGRKKGRGAGGEGKEAQGTSLKPTMGSSRNKCAPGQVLALWSPPPQQYADRLLVWATGAPRPGPPLEEGVAEPAGPRSPPRPHLLLRGSPGVPEAAPVPRSGG